MMCQVSCPAVPRSYCPLSCVLCISASGHVADGHRAGL
jgi:hypothetical protein